MKRDRRVAVGDPPADLPGLANSECPRDTPVVACAEAGFHIAPYAPATMSQEGDAEFQRVAVAWHATGEGVAIELRGVHLAEAAKPVGGYIR